MMVISLTHQGRWPFHFRFGQIWSDLTVKMIQPITSQQTTLSTNHMRAFSTPGGPETGFETRFSTDIASPPPPLRVCMNIYLHG